MQFEMNFLGGNKNFHIRTHLQQRLHKFFIGTIHVCSFRNSLKYVVNAQFFKYTVCAQHYGITLQRRVPHSVYTFSVHKHTCPETCCSFVAFPDAIRDLSIFKGAVHIVYVPQVPKQNMILSSMGTVKYGESKFG